MNDDPRPPFSRRHGYQPSDREIIIREEAPEEFRATILHISGEVGLQPSTLLAIMCRVLRKLDQGNWSGSYIWEEVQALIKECEWFRVYDIAEAISTYLAQDNSEQAYAFDSAINEYLDQRVHSNRNIRFRFKFLSFQ